MAEPIHHAGLSEGRLNLLVFEDKGLLQRLLRELGFEVETDKILDQRHQEECQRCHEPLTVDNLGNIMPGSLLLFCDNPFCLSTYVSEHYPEEPA